MHSVHAALEQSLAAAADAQRQAAAPAAPADRPRRERLLAALELFGSQAGLARSAALLQDLQQFTAASGAGQQQQQQQAGGGQGPAAASQHAAAYAAYIASLARLCAAADGPEEEEQVRCWAAASEAGGRAGTHAPLRGRRSAPACLLLPRAPACCSRLPSHPRSSQALLRLLANAYVVYLQHLTSGGRVGAAAAQRLGLAQAGAHSFYRWAGRWPEGRRRPAPAVCLAFRQAWAAAALPRPPPHLPAPRCSDYPRLPAGARPLERFVGAANQLGALLSAGQQEALMQVRPAAAGFACPGLALA